jgi:hypothetical protein
MKQRFCNWTLVVLPCLAAALSAQTAQPPADKKPMQAQGASTVAYRMKDGQETVDITNVAYEMTGSGIPGRPKNERLMLRKTVRTREIVDEIGMEASTLVQAWPLGADLKQAPLYAVTASGTEPKTIGSDLLVISRGVEEVEWWSTYTLGTGAHLFDTYVPVLQFRTGSPTWEPRYAGTEVPPDDVKDTRLRARNVVAVLTYASPERVLREALITCDSVELATLLRSYADSTHRATVVEKRLPAAPGKKAPVDPAYSIAVSVSPSDPSRPESYTVTVPIAKDDLDLAHATMPAGLHIVAWKR